MQSFKGQMLVILLNKIETTSNTQKNRKSYTNKKEISIDPA